MATSTWTWRYAPEGTSAEPAVAFSNQSDAESWLGEVWRTLAEDGVERVSLYADDRELYTMSLTP